MKTSFKVARGHVWHIRHDTKTEHAYRSAWTLCGQYYNDGELGTHQPTCPGCLKVDNPLTFTPDMRQFMNDVVDIKNWTDYPKSKAFHSLVQGDFITSYARLTRRGDIIAEDFRIGAVPMADTGHVMHLRVPLGYWKACDRLVKLDGVDFMTTERYGKLRLANEHIVVTCLQCLTRRPYEDL